jgi:hypothetical protein
VSEPSANATIRFPVKLIDAELQKYLEREYSMPFEEGEPRPTGYEYLNWVSIADGILDRLVHNAHRIEMRGTRCAKKHGTQSAS